MLSTFANQTLESPVRTPEMRKTQLVTTCGKVWCLAKYGDQMVKGKGENPTLWASIQLAQPYDLFFFFLQPPYITIHLTGFCNKRVLKTLSCPSTHSWFTPKTCQSVNGLWRKNTQHNKKIPNVLAIKDGIPVYLWEWAGKHNHDGKVQSALEIKKIPDA